MCGRFAYVASNEELKSQFHLSNAIEITPRFNIAPGSRVLCLVKTNVDEIQGVVLHWGSFPLGQRTGKNLEALSMHVPKQFLKNQPFVK